MTPRPGPWTRGKAYYARNASRMLFREKIAIAPNRPLVSFTFDDFPRAALLEGGRILRSHGKQGTFYVSLGLLGKESPSGEICNREDLIEALNDGHELGCHTFDHLHSWNTAAVEYEQSILRNREALRELLPTCDFESFSYPIAAPRPSAKAKAARYFVSSRGGGQCANTGEADLNQLSAYFLEQSGGDLAAVAALIEENARRKGWLIFATHDIAGNPSRYGCTPGFFEAVVKAALSSDSTVLPVRDAVAVLRSGAA